MSDFMTDMSVLNVSPQFVGSKDSLNIFYGIFSVYMIGMLSMALYGLRQKSNAGEGKELETHFLANKGFGTLVIFFNIVASYLSGWVVTGVPNDAGGLGHIIWMWIPACSVCGSIFNVLWPRLRRIGVKRGYMGPGDFYGDRYNNRVVVLLCSLFGCIFMAIFAMVEWLALMSVLDALLQGEINSRVAVWFLAGFVFMCEMLGGMTSVALTDAIQAAIMVMCFMIMPFLCEAQWGGFAGITDDNCQNRERVIIPEFASLPRKDLNLTHTKIIGCMPDTDPGFLQYPGPWAARLMFSLAVAFIPGCIAPFSIHRVMVAKDDAAISNGVALVHAYPYCFFTPGILLGLSKKVLFPDVQGNAFAIMCYKFMEMGGVYTFMSILLLTSCVASFMSTADSIVLATSNQLTMDFFIGWFHPQATQKQTLYFSKATSLGIILISVSIPLYAEVNFVQLLNLGLGFMGVCFPAACLGMYTNIHSVPVIVGIAVGFIALLVTEILTTDSSDPLCSGLTAENPDYSPAKGVCVYFFSSTYGMFFGMISTIASEFLLRSVAPKLLEMDYTNHAASLGESRKRFG